MISNLRRDRLKAALGRIDWRRIERDVDTDWVSLVGIVWLACTIWFCWARWPQIYWLSLGDTDDNMRLMQVRALLDGQGWYDLRNYRLNPPLGFDIHWSRIVDLPIAGLILFFRLFTSPFQAEKLACGIAPLLPLGVTMLGIGFTVRRVVSPIAWPLALAALLCCSLMLTMFMPERIDHHGWQLAMLSLTVAGLADPRQARGGALVGCASAVSLSIGLEMLPYCAMAGAILALRWVWDRIEARRLAVYGITLGGGGAFGFAAFASYANRALRCDALTPVWLSVLVLGGALLLVLAWASPEARWLRLVLALAAGAAVAAMFALAFPQCLGRPEQVSPELARTWLNNVREAKPIYAHPFRVAFPIATIPAIGLIGALVATWRARYTTAMTGWAPVLLFDAFAAAMLLWQVRAGPAAQLLAVPGIVALAWIAAPALWRGPAWAKGGAAAAVLIALAALFADTIVQRFRIDPPDHRTQTVNRANGRCPTIPAMAPLDRLPKQTVFTFVDLGPRLIALTHHDAIAGPYHRNGDAILDVQHAFAGSADQFHAIAKRHGATLLLSCPNMSESTNYRVHSRGGFYDQLAHDQVPAWLTPLDLPRNSPLRLWRIN